MPARALKIGPNLRAFIGEVAVKLSRNGIILRLVPKDLVDGCGGYYDSDRQLVVATKREKWPGVFVHEYCHFLQDLDVKAGRPVAYSDPADGYEAVWAALGKQDEWTGQQPWAEAVRCVQAMEADCDKRAVRLIRARKLEIDVKTYIREANVYHLFYEYIAETGRWYKKSPYYHKPLLERMPSTWLRRWELTDELRELFAECC